MTELRTHAELVGALLERDAEIVRLRKGLEGLLEACRAPECEHVHHARNQYHEGYGACPVEAAYEKAVNEARATLEDPR